MFGEDGSHGWLTTEVSCKDKVCSVEMQELGDSCKSLIQRVIFQSFIFLPNVCEFYFRKRHDSKFQFFLFFYYFFFNLGKAKYFPLPYLWKVLDHVNFFY